MAHDTHTIQVSIKVRSPDYEFTNTDQYGEHLYRNSKQKQAIHEAILDQISKTMSTVVTDGEEFVVKTISETSSLNDIETVIHLSKEEEALFDKLAQDEQEKRNRFRAEIDHREAAEDTDLFEVGPGIYSMGDLSGPISQLDETAHNGLARVVIDDGWGDEEPVYSTSAILNPTKWDMFRMFCEALAKSSDKHHVFLEALDYHRTDENGVAIYKALTGS